MKIYVLPVALLLVGCTSTHVSRVHYVPPDEYVDYGTVISVVPVYETIYVSRPARACRYEEVERREGGDSPVATIVGGIIGGVLGHQFGKGAGKDAATIAGGLVGASIGNSVGRTPEEVVVSNEQVCRPISDYERQGERIIGYDVTYRYNGKILTIRTDEDPGDTIPVLVEVEPLD